MADLDLAQRAARNEAFQLVKIAGRILSDAGLVAYADEAARLSTMMSVDAKMMLEQEKRRRGEV